MIFRSWCRLNCEVKLYQFPSSPRCLKVRAVAYELGVELELATVNIFRGESRSPAFEALNPNGLVPVLVDGDFVLWESNAILTYLASTHRIPSLLSTDARERADVDRVLDSSLRNKEYIANRLSVADFALACILNCAEMVGLPVQDSPRTEAWLRRILARESVKQALAESRATIAEVYRSKV